MTAKPAMPAPIRGRHAQINSIPCPHCLMPAGLPCKSPAGSQTTIPHQARRRAAADGGLYMPGGAS